MSRTLRIAVLALGMIAVILGMIAMYARDLKGGTEITLKTEPVDPRSLFLGHYATLGYAINRLEATIVGDRCYEANEQIFVTLEPDASGEWRAVRAAPQMPADGFAQDRVTLRGRTQWGDACPQTLDETARPQTEPLSDDASAQKTDAAPMDPAQTGSEITDAPAEAEEIPENVEVFEPAPPQIWVDYGIEQYFASPEAARRLEDLARRRPTVDGEPEPEPLEIILSVPRSGRALIKGIVIDGEKTYDQTLW